MKIIIITLLSIIFISSICRIISLLVFKCPLCEKWGWVWNSSMTIAITIKVFGDQPKKRPKYICRDCADEIIEMSLPIDVEG
jgi:hypothetical protein